MQAKATHFRRLVKKTIHGPLTKTRSVKGLRQAGEAVDKCPVNRSYEVPRPSRPPQYNFNVALPFK